MIDEDVGKALYLFKWLISMQIDSRSSWSTMFITGLLHDQTPVELRKKKHNNIGMGLRILLKYM